MEVLTVAFGTSTAILVGLVIYLAQSHQAQGERWSKSMEDQRVQLESRIDEYHQILAQYMAGHLDVAYTPSDQSAVPEEPEPRIPQGVADHIKAIEGIDVQSELRQDANGLLASNPDMTEKELMDALFDLEHV